MKISERLIVDNDALPKPNVLAVDDRPANLLTLEAALGKGFNVIPAASGPAAIALLQTRQDIDVILMDAQMPVMDGFEAAARIKVMEGCQDIPIVFVSAIYNEDPFIKQGYKVGAIDYVSKPFDPEILKVKVGVYASFRQKAQVLKERARQLRESEALLQLGRKLAAAHERVGVLVLDAGGTVREANEEAAAIWTQLAPSGMGIDGAIAEWRNSGNEAVRGIGDGLARAFASGITVHNTCETRGPDGLSATLLCTASVLRESGGPIKGAVLVVHDVTERRRIESDLESGIGRLVSPAEVGSV